MTATIDKHVEGGLDLSESCEVVGDEFLVRSTHFDNVVQYGTR